VNNSEQIKDVFEKLEALKNNIDELKKKLSNSNISTGAYLSFKAKTKKRL